MLTDMKLFSDDMSFYKANFHCHTTESDGHVTPQACVDFYADAGYDILSITDHRSVTKIVSDRLLLIPGIEIDYILPGQWVHILGLGMDKAVTGKWDGEGTPQEGIDLIPANISLAGLEVALVNTMNRERILKQFLEPVKKDYDYVLLDCMPSLGMLTVNALAAADTTLIPVQANYLSAKGLEQLLQTINKVKRQINPKLRIEGILLTMVDSRTNYAKEISSLIRDTYGGHIKVFNTEIPRSVRAAEISSEGKSIFLHDPKGKVAEAYQKLTKEVQANAEKRRKHQLEQLR